MTIGLTAFCVVVVYPIITLLTPEPNWLRWWWRTGGAGSTPDDVLKRWEQNQGNLLIAKFILLILGCFVLMRRTHVPPGSLGLRLQQPVGTLLMGLAGGALLTGWVLAMRTLAAKASADGTQTPIFVMRETTSKILLIMVLGGFAEEFWRALALTTLHRAAVSTGHAVLLTSLVFGVGHLLSYKSLGAALGRIAGPAVAGSFLALLFLWSRSLFTPFIAHVLVNSLGALVGRKRAIARQAFK